MGPPNAICSSSVWSFTQTLLLGRSAAPPPSFHSEGPITNVTCTCYAQRLLTLSRLVDERPFSIMIPTYIFYPNKWRHFTALVNQQLWHASERYTKVQVTISTRLGWEVCPRFTSKIKVSLMFSASTLCVEMKFHSPQFTQPEATISYSKKMA